MKILLLRVPNYEEPHVPMKNSLCLGIGYIASYLRENGYNDVTILDAYLEGWGYEKTVQEILNCNYDMIGFTIIFRDMMPHFCEIIKRLRANGVKAHITMGGHYPTFACKDILNDIRELDSVCLFESEYTMLELVRALEKNEDISNIKGLAVRKGESIIVNEPRELIESLDILPFPERNYIEKIDIKYANVGILTSRGCYGSCSFCSINQFYTIPKGHKWRGRSAKNIVDELEMLHKKYGIVDFAFIDDNFFGPGKKGEERVLSFCDEMKKRELNIAISISARVNDGNLEIYKELKEVGVTCVFLGIETGNAGSLNLYNKQVNINQNYEAIKMLDEARIMPHIGLILFEPLMTFGMMIENFKFFNSIKEHVYLSIMDFGKLDVLNGSPMEAKLLDSGVIKKSDFTYSEGYKYSFNDSKVNIFSNIVDSLCKACKKSETLLLNKMLGLYYKIYKLEHFEGRDISMLKVYLDKIRLDTNEQLLQIMERSMQTIGDGIAIGEIDGFVDMLSKELENRNVKALSTLNMYSKLI